MAGCATARTSLSSVPVHGAPVEASDLRAGAALILAGLAAEGETTIRNMKYVDRGYQDLEANLTALGGRVERFLGAAR